MLIVPGVLHCRQSCREGQSFEEQVMLKHYTDVCAVQTIDIVAVGTFDMMRFVEFFTEVTAQQVLIAQVCTQGRPSSCPIYIGIDVHPHHLRPVIVEGTGSLVVTEEFKSILLMIPVNRGFEMQ